ncbi:MAG: AAA family ATPase [Gammaproteobacteria bacterium]|nr:MAG: AAA family ATPase [Gammaproteobacteria bacterium]
MSSRERETLPVVRAADLDEPDPARRWLIEPLWIHGGVGTIGGLPKSCKSWLGLDLAVSVASGTPCLDTFPVRDAGGVLLYMAEDAAPLVKARLLGLCRHRGLALAALPIDVITAPTVRLDLLADQQRLAETVRRLAPRLLVLDPFVRLHQVNENQAGEVAAILGYLRALQRTHHLAVTVVHHNRKNGSATGGLSLRGSGDFFAWVDTALSLRHRQHTLVLSVEHRAAAAPDLLTLGLVGTEQDMHLSIVRAEEPAAPPTTADLDAMILDALEHAGRDGLERASLRAAVRVRNERVGEALTRLATAGHIVRRGDCWVRVPLPTPETHRNGNGNSPTPLPDPSSVVCEERIR